MARLRIVLACSAAILAVGAAAPALADEPKAAIKGELSDDLRAAIVRAVGESKTAAGSRLEARRRAREAAEDVIAVLDSEGYRDNVVTPDIGEGDRPEPVVTVIPGPRFTLAAPKVTWVGKAPAADVQALGVAAMGLKEGEPGRNADVLAAEGRVVATVQKKGYADAAAAPREVIADFADHTIRPEFRVDAGDLVRLDGVDLRTEGRTNPRWVQALAPWQDGEVYDPADVAELERRLLDAGVYDSVTVALGPKDRLINGKRPVLVSLADRPRGTVELGAGYSTTEGVGLDGRWLRYNRLGRADTMTLLFRYAEIERRVEGEVSLPHWRQPQNTLKLGGGVFQQLTDAYDEVGLNAHADITRRYGKTSFRTFGVAIDVTRTDEQLPLPQTRDLVTVTGLGALALDRSSDPLDPKRGWRVDARAEPTGSFGDDTLFYLRMQAQGTAYFAFDKQARSVAAIRLKLGSVSGVSLADVPAARRLYAGGGGSVRGYSYQGVGPRLVNGTPSGGLSLFEASAEMRQELTAKWGVVAFADVGAVGEEATPSFSRVSTGVGFGVRYNLGFGPIRADVAIPLNKRAGDPGYQIYLSIGQKLLTDAAATPPPVKVKRRIIRRPKTGLGWFMLAVTLLVLLVAAAGLVTRYGVLTPQGRMFIEARTSGLKLGRVGKLKIEGLTGDLWKNFSVRRLTVSDEGGVWLEASDVAVSWHSGELFSRRFHAESVKAREVRVIRRPTLTPKTKSKGLPVSFDIDSLAARVEMLPAFSSVRGLFDLSGEFDVERAGGASGRLAAASLMHAGDGLKADFNVGTSKIVKVNVDVVEAQGGALAGAVGLAAGEPFSLTGRASGTTQAGEFSLSTLSGKIAPLSGAGAWNGGGGYANAQVLLSASKLTTDFARRFGPQAKVALKAKHGKGDVYDFDVDGRSENLTLRAVGPADIAKRAARGIALDVGVADMSRLAKDPKMGKARFTGRLTGPLTDWKAKGQLSVETVQLGDFTLALAKGPAEVGWKNKILNITADLAGSGGTGNGLMTAWMGAEPKGTVSLSRLPDQRMLIRSLTADGAGFTLKGTGTRSLLGGMSFDGDVRVTNLGAVHKGATGALAAKWTAGQPKANTPWNLTIDGRGETFASGMAELDRLLGNAPRLKSQAAFEHGLWSFANFDVDGDKARISGAGTLVQTGGALKFSLDWRAKGPFHAGPVEVAGDIKGGGALTGTLSQPKADLTAEIAAIDFPRLQISPAHLVLSFTPMSGGGDGAIKLTGSSAFGEAFGRADFRFADQGLDLSGLDVRAGGVTATGSLALRGSQPSRADLTMTAGPGAFLAGGRANARVKIVDGAGGAQGSMKIDATGLRFKDSEAQVRSMTLTADGPMDRLPYRVTADMEFPQAPVKLDGGGIASEKGQAWAVTFEGGAKIRRTDVKTAGPVTVNFGGPETSAVGAVTVGGGRADFQARQTGEVVAVDARLQGVELGVLQEDLAGRISGALALSGRGSRLTGTLDANLIGARSRDGPANLAIDGAVKARLDGTRLILEANASGAGGLKSTASATLPAESSAAPLRVAIDRTKPISGHFDVDGELQPIWDLFFGGARSLAGRVTAQGTLAGSINEPKIVGEANLANGRFEDQATGLKLTKVTIAADLHEDRVVFRQFNASDERGGTVAGDGQVSLERGGSSTFKLTANRFLLLDNDMAEAQASGAVTVTRGADGNARLAGALTIDRADIVAEPPTPSGVVAMEVVERNRPAPRDDAYRPAVARGPSIALDVKLTAPRRVFVKGRGLDVELSLDAHVGGDTARPQLDGTARVVRGDYQFASKRFEFDERGVIYLASSADRIRLDLSATREDPSLTAVVKVSGTAAKPEITLTSTPVLPSDEVLSQVLFGRSASQLSPVEAAQLASALSGLASGGGLDIIGNLRSLAGLDRLAFAGGDASGVAVSGGKYITDDVYLELTGGGREGPSAQVEWRVRKTLSIVSRLAGTGDTRLSVRWRKDYGKQAK